MRCIRCQLVVWAMMSVVTSPSALAAEEMVLSTVMKEQGKSMQLIAGGIAREDYEQVVKASLAVADPPHPSSTLAEKVRLMRFLGSSVGRFKALDGDAKERATALANAARTRNGEATIAAFQRLQMSLPGLPCRVSEVVSGPFQTVSKATIGNHCLRTHF